MNRLKELRENNSITQQELAEKIGVHYRTIQNWEKDTKTQIKPEKAKMLAGYFDVSVGYLLGYTDIPQKYEDEKFYKFSFDEEETIYPSSDMRDEDEKIKEQFIEFNRYLRRYGVFITNNEIDTVFKLIKHLDINNLYNGDKFLVRGENFTGQKLNEYKKGIYSNILDPSPDLDYTDLETEIYDYVYSEMYDFRKLDVEKAQELLSVLKNHYGERNYLEERKK
ncbi:XRE family transcriptional regulator [Streptococcus pyogenes]|nr:XRE family transcriptional regulator [Streptococcus pyogenes]